MSEEKIEEQGAQEDQQQEQAEPNGVAATEPNGKAEPDVAEYWKSRSRNWEKQFKDLKTQMNELLDVREFATGETKRADDAETALKAAQRELAVMKAASEANVDAGLLAKMTGETPEEISENARMLADGIRAAQAYPVVEDKGSARKQPMTLEDIDAIKDEAARRKAYAAYYEKQMR